MKKEIFISLIEKGFSTREIGKELDKSQTTVRYWLKKYNLKTCIFKKYSSLKIKCKYCKTIDNNQFYGRYNTECKKCLNKRLYNLSRGKKIRAVIYKGGRCNNCGYNKCIAALDFHHLSPVEKDPNFNTMLYWKWERIKKEIDNCVLLCSNCHRELHYTGIMVP